MKRLFVAGITLSLLLMFSFACATKDYVRQQIEPLADCCKKAQKKCQKAFELQQQK
jgi:hypothetical protein